MGSDHYSYDEAAERISSMIDDELKLENLKRKEARRNEVKVMLLGQAESGKSTLQKHFQLCYASKSLDHERPSWRPVVYFNIIKAVHMILDELDYEFSSLRFLEDGDNFSRPSSDVQPDMTEMRAKLHPLVALEGLLASELSGGISLSGGRTGAYVRTGWQALVTSNLTWSRAEICSPSAKLINAVDTAAETLGALATEIDALWLHPTVKYLVRQRRIKLEESAPFFLCNVRRIADPNYVPTTNDILNVRLQTLGVMEHTFPISMGSMSYNWKLYDVGGARGQRHAWVPYFDDATAIIFLAPISAFDQYLEEDPKTNRIEDSLQLFTAICSNKLLAKANLILMLNKIDLLEKKLQDGTKVVKHIPSYGKRPNRFTEVSEYFRAHFVQIHRRKDTSNRTLFVHLTSMLDTQATQAVIRSVSDAIVEQHIAQTGLV